MKHRAVLFILLTIVAAAAAVLSFAALRDLALICGFSPQLAWLLPVTVDAGAAAGSMVWLGRVVVREAMVFARALALTLLFLSVLANAVGHGLAAFGMRPAWWVVVIVSAIAPSVLGAVVHLAVLVGRPEATQPTDETPNPDRSGKSDDPKPFVWLTDEMAQLEHDDFRGAADRFALDPTVSDQSVAGPPTTDGQIIDAMKQWEKDLGRRPSRDEMLAHYKIGATRCRRLRNMVGWIEPAEEADRAPTESVGADR